MRCSFSVDNKTFSVSFTVEEYRTALKMMNNLRVKNDQDIITLGNVTGVLAEEYNSYAEERQKKSRRSHLKLIHGGRGGT